MTRLLHDRYYLYAAEHAWDLATGESVAVSELADAAPVSSPGAEPIVEVLEHGREGEPRWIVVETRAGQSSLAMARRTAEEARARGLVPIAVDVYLRLRSVLHADLRHRTLMLIVSPGTAVERGRQALMEAAAGSPRPHVLVSFRSSRHAGGVGTGLAVREARAVYGARLRADDAAGSPGGQAVAGYPSPDTAAELGLPEDVKKQVVRGSRWEELCRAGRHAAADRLLRDVAAALVRRQAFVPAAAAYMAAGRIALERGRVADADALFAEAASHAQAAGREALVAVARLWQAAARTDAAQLTAAESLCRAALVTGALPGAERARGEATLARVLLWQNRVEEAAARELSAADGDQELAAFVAGMAVRVLVAQGQHFAAGQRARSLLVQAASASRPLVRVLASMAHLRVLVDTGDLVLVEQGLAEIRAASRAARTPLRYVRARLLWVDALRRAGRSRDAERELRDLKRVSAATPPLLRAAIDGRLKGDVRLPRIVLPGNATSVAASLVALARDEEQDRHAVRRVLVSASELLRTSRLELCSCDAGPDSVVMSIGSGLATSIGSRVLDAGITIDARTDAGGELGVPVRVGARLVAALVARWPVDRVPPAQARELLELTAAVAGSRVDAMRAAAREEAAAATAIPELVGSSAAIAEVRRAVARAATAPFSVLIEGESGSGKELVARALHHLSPRRERRFCDLNCAALPDELLESELFGHVRGAFTGAVADRPGLVEEADGGTLFLDEVADLSPRAQAKLLRVLQQQEVRRVGATFSRKVDVRVVSAANRDMRVQVSEGRFRQDLLYRLDVIRVRVPPLRERPEDVAALAQHFWQIAAARVGTRAVLSHGVLAALSRYHWPGNVRELQNVMAGLAVAGPASGQVKSGLLPPAVTGAAAAPTTRMVEARDQFERRVIEVALARSGGRRTRAARELGLSRQGLLKMMIRLGLS